MPSGTGSRSRSITGCRPGCSTGPTLHFVTELAPAFEETSQAVVARLVADLLAMSRTTVIKYEAGDYPSGPRLHAMLTRRVRQWAEATGVDPEWLLTGTATEEAG